jgi:hypothetical protein
MIKNDTIPISAFFNASDPRILISNQPRETAPQIHKSRTKRNAMMPQNQ